LEESWAVGVIGAVSNPLLFWSRVIEGSWHVRKMLSSPFAFLWEKDRENFTPTVLQVGQGSDCMLCGLLESKLGATGIAGVRSDRDAETETMISGGTSGRSSSR